MKRNLENKINNFNCCFLKKEPFILKKRVKTGRHPTFFDKSHTRTPNKRNQVFKYAAISNAFSWLFPGFYHPSPHFPPSQSSVQPQLRCHSVLSRLHRILAACSPVPHKCAIDPGRMLIQSHCGCFVVSVRSWECERWDVLILAKQKSKPSTS